MEQGGHLAFAGAQYAVAGAYRLPGVHHVQGDDLAFVADHLAGTDLQRLVAEHFTGLRVDIALANTVDAVALVEGLPLGMGVAGIDGVILAENNALVLATYHVG